MGGEVKVYIGQTNNFSFLVQLATPTINPSIRYLQRVKIKTDVNHLMMSRRLFRFLSLAQRRLGPPNKPPQRHTLIYVT